MENCLFCNIVSKDIPASIVHEDDHVIAFRDVNPQAPVHVLIVPRRHISTVNHLTDEDQSLIGHMILIAGHIARKLEVDDSGYRLVMNCNQEGGQTVFHIHLHILGGRQLTHLG